MRAYVSKTGVLMLSVNYRLAPEHPHPTPVEDAYVALEWLLARAGELGFDAKQVAVMGDSAGGGLAAGVALLARDRGVELARQILVYPMLDNLNQTPNPTLEPFAVWSYDANFTGWRALLGKEFLSADAHATAAPSRATNLAGLAPAYIEVGDIDIFRDEDIDYAHRLLRAGVPVELHVHPGAPHAFDVIAPSSQLAMRAMTDRIRAIKGLGGGLSDTRLAVKACGRRYILVRETVRQLACLRP